MSSRAGKGLQCTEVLLAASSTEKWADRPQKLNLGLQLAPQLVEALMTSGSYSRSHCALEEDRPVIGCAAMLMC